MFLSFAVLVSLSLTVRAQEPGQTDTFASALGNDPSLVKCLSAASNADGAAVVLGDCTSANAQWTVPEGANNAGTLQIFGDKCLDVTNGATINGNKLQIWTCATANTNQLFVPNGYGGTIQWSGTNKCLDTTDGVLADGTPVRPLPCFLRTASEPDPQIQIWDCDSTNRNQQWIPDAESHPKSFTITPKSATSLCVAASSAAVNASVILSPCTSNGGSAGFALQHWQDPTAIGQLMIPTPTQQLCVAPMGSTAASGTKLVLQVCDPQSAAQRWGHQTGNIVNALTEHDCLDLTDGNAVAGTQLQIWGCGFFGGVDNTNQDWIETDAF
ncbi:ricin B lectin domain-containing protein [Mycena sanguinolenta]|nr:ricin B lectin domain-containing protein [Mycena sanguinolenta]